MVDRVTFTMCSESQSQVDFIFTESVFLSGLPDCSQMNRLAMDTVLPVNGTRMIGPRKGSWYPVQTVHPLALSWREFSSMYCLTAWSSASLVFRM